MWPLGVLLKELSLVKFPIFNFSRDVCIRLKLHVRICHRKMQVKFEFSHGPMILTELSLLNLGRRKKKEISSLHSLTLVGMYV
jgi:hypothetical protein